MRLPSDDGVYLYRDGQWSRVVVEGPFVPEVDGIYVIYFRNIKCAGCKSFDSVWLEFTSFYTQAANYCIVQCKNFFVECDDATAADTYIFYLVFETPQVLVTIVENGLPIYIEREVGFMEIDRLRDFVLNVRDRMALDSTGDLDNEAEGIYIDFSKKNWREIVEQLRRLIFNGKNLSNLCTDEGCRIVID